MSQGKSIEEAVANLREATELYLEEFPPEKGRRPFMGGLQADDRRGAPKTRR